MAAAETGSGKTGAFGLPLLQVMIGRQHPQRRPGLDDPNDASTKTRTALMSTPWMLMVDAARSPRELLIARGCYCCFW